ncbi:UNVERIFIED_CONTAM: hypothetical protein HDU68_008299, partial [Siphonaria sp. JEL0065]
MTEIFTDVLKSRYRAHLQAGKFDLSIKYPENDENVTQAGLFDRLYIVCAPEILPAIAKAVHADKTKHRPR